MTQMEAVAGLVGGGDKANKPAMQATDRLVGIKQSSVITGSGCAWVWTGQVAQVDGDARIVG